MNYMYLGGGMALFIRRSGLRLKLDMNDLGMVNFVSTDIYEPDVHFAIAQFAKPGSVVIDIGANLGIHSLSAAQFVREGGGRVVAVEANPKLSVLLKENILINGYSCIECHNLAAWNTDTELEFSSMPNAHRVGAVRLETGTNFGDRTIRVKARRMDSLVPDKSRVSLIKIDVEGREPFVIEGLRETIESSSCAVIAEYQDSLIEPIYGNAKFSTLMDSLGRVAWGIDHANKTLVRLETLPKLHTNLVWLPKGLKWST